MSTSYELVYTFRKNPNKIKRAGNEKSLMLEVHDE